ncbi:hypothetical protein [uncultured Nitrospira sp.]
MREGEGSGDGFSMTNVGYKEAGGDGAWVEGGMARRDLSGAIGLQYC